MDKGAPSAEWSLAARRPVSCGRGSPRRGTQPRTFPRKRGKLPSPSQAFGRCPVLVPGQRPIEWSQRRLLLALPALPFRSAFPYFHLFPLLAWKHRLCSYERRVAPGPRAGVAQRAGAPSPGQYPPKPTRAHTTPLGSASPRLCWGSGRGGSGKGGAMRFAGPARFPGRRRCRKSKSSHPEASRRG